MAKKPAKLAELERELAQLRALQTRLLGKRLEAADWSTLSTLLGSYVDRSEAVLARTIAQIAAAAAKAEAARAGADDGSRGSAGTAPGLGDAPSDDEAVAKPGGADAGPKDDDDEDARPTNHGKNGAAAYANATHIRHLLAPGLLGALCEYCKSGKMYRYRDKLIVRVVGQPMFGAEVHHLEQCRCRICHRVIRAKIPADVLAGIGSSYVNYHWTACAMLGVLHYFAGMPFKRLEALQAGWGVPMADANQWEVASQSSELLKPLLEALVEHALEHADSLRIDDTGSKVVEIQRLINAEIKALESEGASIKGVRTGINATGVYVETAEGAITLYYTGLHHAGEVLDRLLARRRVAGKLVTVTDAASKNFSKSRGDKVVEGACNAHALLSFRDIKDKFPAEYAVAGAAYKEIFANDDIAKERGMSPEERRDFHRAHSLPLLEGLKAMCAEKLASKLVEPNSPLWQPLNFILNQWKRLSRFCEVPGVPLDTNLVEQSLIIPVRYLAASFNYQTVNGAGVGDCFMSLVVTACENEIEPVAWLAHCLENHEDLARRPAYYLPWAYRERTSSADSAQPAMD